MFKKVMTYTDFNGITRKETFYFHLSEAELAEMELSKPGGMSALLSRIIDSREDSELIKIFKDLVLKSYGEKSPDGKYFKKSKEIVEAFMQTQAYSDLFMELATDSNAAAEFVNAIIPDSIKSEVNKSAALPIAE